MAEMSPADVPQQLVGAAFSACKQLQLEASRYQLGDEVPTVDIIETLRRALAAVLPLHKQQVLAELHAKTEWGVENVTTGRAFAMDTEAEARDLAAGYRRAFPAHPHRAVTRLVSEWREATHGKRS